MPEISVIVPVYKAENYLCHCIDSILGQSFVDFELILVDDGSPDGSGAICDEYAKKDDRIRVIHQKNRGVSSARNAGLDAARGNWVTFIDSDDYVKKEFLEHLYECEYDLIIGGYEQSENLEGTTKKVYFASYEIHEMDRENMQALLESNGKQWIYVCWGRLFRRSIIESKQIRFDTRFCSGEDTIFTVTYLACCNHISIKPVADYCYIHHKNGSLSTTLSVPLLDAMWQTEKITSKIMEDRFGITSLSKTEEQLCQFYANCYGDIIMNRGMSFAMKLDSLRYLFKNHYFIKAVNDIHVYFPETSKAYKMLLKTKRPLLILTVMTTVDKMK